MRSGVSGGFCIYGRGFHVDEGSTGRWRSQCDSRTIGVSQFGKDNVMLSRSAIPRRVATFAKSTKLFLGRGRNHLRQGCKGKLANIPIQSHQSHAGISSVP